MFLTEAIAVFQLLKSFGSLCSSAYAIYASLDPDLSVLKSLGLHLQSHKDLYISNKKLCIHLTQRLELLSPTLEALFTQYPKTKECPPHLKSGVTHLESTLEAAKNLVHKNVLPPHLNLLQRQWWIAKRIQQASQMAERFSQLEAQISQAVHDLDTGVGVQILKVVNQTSDQVRQQDLQYTELKDYILQQNLQMDQILATLLQVLEPRPDQDTLQTLLASQNQNPTWIPELRKQMEDQHQSQTMPILQKCVTQIEQQLQQNTQLSTQLKQMQAGMQDLETQLTQHTDRIMDQIQDVRLGFQEFMEQLVKKESNVQTQILLRAIQQICPAEDTKKPVVSADPKSWKYTFKEFKIEDLQIDFQNRKTFLGHGTGGQVFRGKLHFREIAFKRLALQQIWNLDSSSQPALSTETTESSGASSLGRSSLSPNSSDGPAILSPQTDFDEIAIKILKREARIVWALNGNTYCVQLYGICLQPVGLIFEYCNAGTLQSRLYRTVYNETSETCAFQSLQVLKIPDKISLVGQLIQGLYHLHSKGFVHRDLKSPNCLIHNYGTAEVPLLNLKITDFGSSRKIADFVHSSPYSNSTGGADKHQNGGTWRWLAPERRKKLKREEREQIESHPEIDIYGLGCIIGEIFTEMPPYPEMEEEEEIRSLPKEILPYTDTQLSLVPAEIVEIIKRCCEGEAKERIKIQDLMYKEWPQVCGGLIGERKEKEKQAERTGQERKEEEEKNEIQESESIPLMSGSTRIFRCSDLWVYTFRIIKICISLIDPRGKEIEEPEGRKDETQESEEIEKASKSRQTLKDTNEAVQNDKPFVLTTVKQNGLALQFASPKFKRDKQIVMAAVVQDGRALEFASPKLQQDKQIVMAAVQRDGNALCYASQEMKNDKQIVLSAVQRHGEALQYASSVLRDDKKVVYAAIKQSGEALCYASEALQNDKPFILSAAKKHEEEERKKELERRRIEREESEKRWKEKEELERTMKKKEAEKNKMLERINQDDSALKDASEELRNDKDIVLAAVARNGGMLQFASPELQKDKAIVSTAVVQNACALQYACEDMKSNREIVLTAVKVDGQVLQYANLELQNDKEVVLAAVQQNGLALEFASPRLQKNEEIVLTATKQNGSALEYVSPEFQYDKSIVLAAVVQKGQALEFASPKLQNNREIVLVAVQHNGTALQFASPELRNDREIVLAAVKHNGDALQYAGLELRKDAEIILVAVQCMGPQLTNDQEFISAAVQISGLALKYASPQLQNNREIVLAALKQDGNALQFAPRLRGEKHVVIAALEKDGNALQYASEKLKSNEEIVSAAVRQNGNALQYASQALQDNGRLRREAGWTERDEAEKKRKKTQAILDEKNRILDRVKKDGWQLQYVSGKDKEIVLAAVKQNGEALQFGGGWDEDKDIVLAAVQQNCYALKYASRKLQKDKDIVLAAVKQSTGALAYADSGIWKDKDFVLEMVQKDGSTLSSASEELQNDKEIVLTAVKQSGYALRSASDALKNDKEVVLAAVKQDGQTLQFASKKLQRNKEVRYAAGKSSWSWILD